MNRLEQLGRDFAAAHVEVKSAKQARREYWTGKECQGCERHSSSGEDDNTRCYIFRIAPEKMCEVCQGSITHHSRYHGAVIARRVAMTKLIREGLK